MAAAYDGDGNAAAYDGDGNAGAGHGTGDPEAVLASFGEGATSEGDFHEAMNVAGVFDAPVVFLCQNNRYAISTPAARQTACASFAGKAKAYGFEGMRVDGNDVLAVRRAVDDALERARAGGGPTLVEAVTYRRGAHTTTDDPSKYRDQSEAADHPDPIAETREHLRTSHDWTGEDDATVRAWAEERVQEAVGSVDWADDSDPGELFDHVYASMPAKLAEQRGALSETPGGNEGL